AATGAGSIAGPALGGVTADLLSFAAPFLIVCGVSVALALAAPTVLPTDSRRRMPHAPVWAPIRGSIGHGVRRVCTTTTRGGGGRCGADRSGRAARLRLSSRPVKLGDRAVVRRVDSGRRGARTARRPLGRSAGPARPRSRRTHPDGGVGAVARSARRHAGGGS